MKPLQEEKRTLEDKKKNLGERMDKWVKQAQDAFRFACTARSAFEHASLHDKKVMLVSLGSNFLLKDRVLLLDLLKPFQYIESIKSEADEITNRFEPQEGIDMKTQIGALYASSPVLSRGEDSNLRSRLTTDLQSVAIGHSATSGDIFVYCYCLLLLVHPLVLYHDPH